MNKFILLFLSLVLFSSCVYDSDSAINSLYKEVAGKKIGGQTESLILDSDCDGVEDSLDLCPGIDDNIDGNGDNLPDCKYPPGYANVISQWKCGTPAQMKVRVCTKTPSGGYITVCTYYSAVQTHINNGGFLGICGSSSCNN